MIGAAADDTTGYAALRVEQLPLVQVCPWPYETPDCTRVACMGTIGYQGTAGGFKSSCTRERHSKKRSGSGAKRLLSRLRDRNEKMD